MIRKVFLFAAFFAIAGSARAQQATGKFDYTPTSGVQDISVAVDKVRVNQITFKPGSTMGPTRRSTAECVVRTDNDGQVDVQVGVAVVIFDADGNIVAAGSGGTQVGWLSKGERDTSSIAFSSVYRNLSKAKTFTVTLEVLPKSDSK